MSRCVLPSLLLVAVWLAWPNPTLAQAPTWSVTKVERSDQGFVTETKLNPISGLHETKNLLVFGKKNEFLKITMSARPDKKGFFPTSHDFKLLDEDGKPAGKQTFFLKGKDNSITLVYQGDWAKLDGLTLEGPGPRSHPIGKAVPKKK